MKELYSVFFSRCLNILRFRLLILPVMILYPRMELNVKQSGIERRILQAKYFKNRGGRVVKAVHECYLRNDIPCGWRGCSATSCPLPEIAALTENRDENLNHPGNHAILADADAFLRFYDVLNDKQIRNVVACQSVWDYVKKKAIKVYKQLKTEVYEEKSGHFSVFLNELCAFSATQAIRSETQEQRQERSLLSAAEYLQKHWKGTGIEPIIVCGDEERAKRMQQQFPATLSLASYIQGMKWTGKQKLLDQLAAYDAADSATEGDSIFDEYLSHDEVMNGIAAGTVKKATFNVSRENYREARVQIGDEEWLIRGRHCNRAVHGDTVAVEMLPKEQWLAPEQRLRLRDVDEINMNADDEVLNKLEDSDEPPVKKAKAAEPPPVPTAKVVAIIRRNWRPYCGILLPSIIKGGRRHLFCPAERLIPRVRIETEQAELLSSQRIVVSIDGWPRNSKYPLGHYVRALGKLGDKDVENEVLLLEHDIPHAPFSESVLSCLPSPDWRPENPLPAGRVDLRHLCICSVDPLGCTDIDDALHARPLGRDGLIEVGVHIADVTHFVRPGSAMDEEAAVRSTTVYLADQRIDMLPGLLSGNLCSLRGGEERYAFSVIWEMTPSAMVVNTRFHKSLIKSRAALSYEKAQEMVDDKADESEVTTGLRQLRELARLLRAKRRADGALVLASSEVRFEMDWETKTPTGIQNKKQIDTHWMVEEFMLLANISVAEKILADYPDCALLRRHPVPSESSYKPLIQAAAQRGFSISVESGKVLADSLDRAVDPKHPMLNTLMRMMATRCMTQAVYFSAGTVPVDQYQHFGLATPIYTHFTSPIRRYADVMVHRLLAASIEADEINPGLLSQLNVSRLTQNMNYRHKQAQYAGRASVQLITLTYFRDKQEEAQAFIVGIRDNGIQVFVPRYGIESVIVLGGAATVDVAEGVVRAGDASLRLFQSLTVRIRLDTTRQQRPRIVLDLLSPAISAALSADFDLSSSEGTTAKTV